MPNTPASRLIPWLRLRRWGLFTLVLATSVAGCTTMLRVTHELPWGLQVILLILFALTFTWVALAFWSALCGFLLCLMQRDPLTLARNPAPEPVTLRDTSRTALIMPIFQEPPEATFAGLEASCRSLLAQPGHTASFINAHFEVFVLSDTQDPDAAESEAAHVAALQHRLKGQLRLHYRRRANNHGRKAGNIADFCRRWGRRYDFFIVLDADSIMGGATLLHLVRKMQQQPDVGLIQSVPIPVGQVTLFGRLVQFAAALYSPMLAAGQSFWQGDTANYWGHNAIVRTRAFMTSSGLPTLPGKPPLGGELLSHDFVEAALLRRQGWKVLLDTALPLSKAQSFEAMPSNLLDFAKRDRRWLQGNLQHLRLLTGAGLHSLSRWHFFFGAFAYLSSPVWLALLFCTSVLIGYTTLTDTPTLHATPLSWGLLGTTLLLLIAPKLMGLALAFCQTPKAFGGRLRLTASTLLEIAFAALLAPLMMAWHSLFILAILRGRAIQWHTQPRSERSLSWPEAWQHTRSTTVAGGVWMLALGWLSPAALGWLAPAWLGLVTSMLLVKITSSISLGNWLARQQLLDTPYQHKEPVLSAYTRHVEGARARPQPPTYAPLLPPPEQPGDMPIQSFSCFTPATRRLPTTALKDPY
ncbi:glucans biosynthesis glucosyltransferase MdoH [Halomonas vilamensis]|uniref:Glucans biosynthesis glucosyltransferase H n=1 Tax=Vreelandella vilamensis TaxID=531309 RepID=A0ABU1H0Z1_9GAMM|nr:glucans biosynthesis glucosyltransferase MdoH [Halomonas vilamensis]MDR5897968.1 glucans biosynthesis glucosyltransferase MdoH [Halomonas vilamensis]